jgi:RNA polymerase sigma-70 factor (ECF subfamily)
MARSLTEEDIRGIYRASVDELYGFVSRRTDGDRDLAEDITQETWLRAVRAWQAAGIPDRPLAWLVTVAARLLANHFRRPAVARADAGAVDALPAPDAAQAREAAERRSLVERALARLPLPEVRLLEAFHYDRRAVAEIAAETGLTERAVEGRLRRARQKLRRELESEGDHE